MYVAAICLWGNKNFSNFSLSKVEGCGTTEHVGHVHGAGHIPLEDVTVEVGVVPKGSSETHNVLHVPRAQRVVGDRRRCLGKGLLRILGRTCGGQIKI